MKLSNLFKNTVVKSSIWYTISEFFNKGLIFLTIPIFTRLLSTNDYGIISLYTTWVNIFTIIISLDLVVTIGRAKIDFKENYENFLSSVVFLSLIVFFIFFGIFYIFEDSFIKMTSLSKVLFYLMVLQSYFLFIKNFILNKLKFEYKYIAASIITVVSSVLTLSLSIYLIVYVTTDHKYLGEILGKFTFISILGVFSIIYLLYKKKSYINFEYWKYSLAISVPLIIHNLSFIINTQFDRILIDKYIDKSTTGIYSFAYNVAMIVAVLLRSTNQAWAPWFYSKMNSKEYGVIKNRAILFRNFFTYAYTLILFFSPELIKIMAAKKYWDGLFIIPWIFLAYYFQFMYTFEVNISFFHKKTLYISIGTIFSAIINIILNIIFIPKYGFVAAAITTVVSYFFLFIFHYILTNYILKIKVFDLKFHLKSFLYVFFVTFLYLYFEKMVYYRISIVLIFTIVFYKKLKISKE